MQHEIIDGAIKSNVKNPTKISSYYLRSARNREQAGAGGFCMSFYENQGQNSAPISRQAGFPGRNAAGKDRWSGQKRDCIVIILWMERGRLPVPVSGSAGGSTVEPRRGSFGALQVEVPQNDGDRLAVSEAWSWSFLSPGVPGKEKPKWNGVKWSSIQA
ncbi:MAG: hypothetical protein P4L43_09490 [Syntrophobacteraceae bacterium]|nr:hypothetical protein [Syntrophobacteraceae bacterium]